MRAALCVLGALAFANSIDDGFALDPNELVLKDMRIRAVTAENLGLILHQDFFWMLYPSGLYRPVTTATFLFNYAILDNGESAVGYHALNLLLHLVNALLVFALARRLLPTPSAAFAAAALWEVHPIVTEGVTNIGGRADLLAAFAVLTSLLIYVRSAEWHGWRRYVALGGFFAAATAGVFSKENAAVLLGLMALWDLVNRRDRPRWEFYGAAGLSLAVMAAVRSAVFRALPASFPPFVDNPLIGEAFWSARLTAVKTIGLELWLMVCPWQLSSDRSYHAVDFDGWGAWAALLVIGGILAAVIARRRQDSALFWAAGFFGIALLPVSNLIFPVGAMVAERFLYLPSIGFAVAAAALLYRIPKAQVRNAAIGAVVLLLAARTFARNGDWQDDLTLATHDVAVVPDSFKLHTLLAQELLKRDPQGNLDAATHQLETAAEILRPLPDRWMPQQNLVRLGDAYLVKGNASGGPSAPEGRRWYEKAVPVLEHARAVAQLAEKEYDAFQQAHGKTPSERFASQDLYYDLGVAYGSLGRYAEALETLEYGRNINPDRTDFYVAISAAYTGLQRPQDSALTLLEKAQLEGARTGDVAAATLCRAQSELAAAFTGARRPARAEEMKAIGRRYGCAGM